MVDLPFKVGKREALVVTKKSSTGSKEERVTQLVEAVLVFNTIREAADSIGLPYSTARNWLYEPATQELLRQARTQVYTTALSQLSGMAAKAVKVIGSALDRGDVSVAKWLMDRGDAMAFAELNDRVDELEKKRNSNAR
jgi:hypothetical protein